MMRFLRSQLVALVATAADFLVSWLLLLTLPHCDASTAVAVAAGAATGAVAACVLNHKWTFGGNGNGVATVAGRYAMVWLGSLALNTVGTVWLSHHVAPVILAKAIVAVAVAWGWNYPLFARFVYAKKKLCQRCDTAS